MGRVLKAEKTSIIVLQTIRVDKFVSVKLSLSLFDKQIYSILSYIYIYIYIYGPYRKHATWF